MSEKLMRSLLSADSRRIVFEILLKGDFTAREIQKKLGKTESHCSTVLSELEGRGLVVFKEGKWSATKEGKEVYQKYFG